jgi:hypothetical protein
MARHIARMGEMHTVFLLENVNGTNNPEDLGVDRKTILEWILRKYFRRCEVDPSESG